MELKMQLCMNQISYENHSTSPITNIIQYKPHLFFGAWEHLDIFKIITVETVIEHKVRLYNSCIVLHQWGMPYTDGMFSKINGIPFIARNYILPPAKLREMEHRPRSREGSKLVT